MKSFVKFVASLLLVMAFAASSASAQTQVKLNALYLLGGVINPAVEFSISKRLSYQTEIVYSPWYSIESKGVGRPMQFAIASQELRYHFNAQRPGGWYLGANIGLSVFRMTRPILKGGFRFKDSYGKGYGIISGGSGGYQWIFNNKWVLDARFGINYQHSMYNAYALVDGFVDGVSGTVHKKGEIVMDPKRDRPRSPLDPFNDSGEWFPSAAVSFGILLHPRNK